MSAHAPQTRWLTVDTGEQALYDPTNADAWIQSSVVERVEP